MPDTPVTRTATPATEPGSAPVLAESAVDERGIATVTIRGTHSVNIIGAAAIADATVAVAALRDREQVRVLVLRGPDDSFVGGADIDEMARLDADSAVPFIEALASLCEGLRRFPRPVIARLAGWCLGGGLEIAMACDLRIASREAHFGMPEVLVGIPSVIHAALMPRLIGQSRAAWLLLTGESIDAAVAERWGLVNEVVDAAGLDAAVAHRAGRLAGLGPQVSARQKQLLRSWEDQPLDASIGHSVAAFSAAFRTGEPQHFMGEFLARRRRK
jgi:enoyl-CoA hydratase/carnithine racemase